MSGCSKGDIDHEAVTGFLRTLPLRERVELINEVLQEFQELDLGEDGAVLFRSTYLVANLTYGTPPSPADVVALALPAKEEWGYISDILNQGGSCSFCGTVLTGFSKRSICPACGSIVGMT